MDGNGNCYGDGEGCSGGGGGTTSISSPLSNGFTSVTIVGFNTYGSSAHRTPLSPSYSFKVNGSSVSIGVGKVYEITTDDAISFSASASGYTPGIRESRSGGATLTILLQ